MWAHVVHGSALYMAKSGNHPLFGIYSFSRLFKSYPYMIKLNGKLILSFLKAVNYPPIMQDVKDPEIQVS